MNVKEYRKNNKYKNNLSMLKNLEITKITYFDTAHIMS